MAKPFVCALSVLTILVLSGCSSTRVETGTKAEKGDGIRGCPRENWPGPWTACSEADWVRRVVEGSRYHVTGETGSALIAMGGDKAFLIWTTELTRTIHELVTEEHWARLSTIEGVEVYGDERVWRFWSAQGFVFWVHEGPRERSALPEPKELAPLIRESLRLEPPPR